MKEVMVELPSEPFVFSNCMLSNIILSRTIRIHRRGISPIIKTEWLMIIMDNSLPGQISNIYNRMADDYHGQRPCVSSISPYQR